MSQDSDRRVWIRHECAMRGTCRSVRELTPEGWKATILDVSAGGIRFRLDRQFERGDLVLVELPAEKSISLQARVMHVHELAHGFYEIGCAFLRELDDAQLQELL